MAFEIDAYGPDPTGWFHVPSLELPLVTKLCNWCIHSFFEGFEKAKDLVFPSRAIKRDLQTTLSRLEDLENEFKKLKEDKENLRQSSCQYCNSKAHLRGCNINKDVDDLQKSTNNSDVAVNTSFVFAPGPMPSEPTLSTKSSAAPLPSLAPPPPPPPLPPPDLLFKPVDLSFLKKKKSTKSSSPTEKSKAPVVITLQDLQKVKLKPVQVTQDESGQVKKALGNQPVVLLDDLKRVQLKRSSSESDKSDEDVSSTGTSPSELKQLWKSIPKEVEKFQNRLKKVDIARSPGGTPIRPLNPEEHGTGLTPLMTKALRRKFKRARTPSSSPLSLSPIACEQR
ncbi:proline-rich protein 11-like [Ptychodera flava]|uniref:proline-rich protein 11-like n=1 Tax=Ptychodera flava TaxID=63121 RepID=UPI003969C750